MDRERSFEDVLAEYAKRQSPLWCYLQIELLAKIAIELWKKGPRGDRIR